MKNLLKSLNFKFRFLLLTLIFATAFSEVRSQSITNYAFSASAGTFTPLSGANVATLSGGSNDEGYYNTLPVGFNFTYMGVTYSNFSASTNGWMTLGQPISSAALTNALATGGNRPVISPLWDDNDMASGTLSYQTSGAPGNQILTIEWLNVEWRYTVNAPVISFQVKIYEATGAIEFVYRQDAGTVVTGTASIGITGTSTGAGNYLSLNNSGAAPTVSSTTETTSISTKPANGQTYTFTPPSVPPAAPITFAASPIGLTSMTISWLDNSSTEGGFNVYRSLDNISFSFVGSVPSTSVATTGTLYSLNQTGLSANTTYYYNIVSSNEAFISAPLNGNATTLTATFCGNKTVGPTGDYLSLTAAFSDIAVNGLACSSLLELQSAYSSTVETFPIIIPYFGNTNATTLTVRPEAGASNLLITSDTTQTLNLNGATAIIFDGRAGGSGANALTIANTRKTGTAISFINGASYNNFHDLVIQGVDTIATNGVITFLTSIGATGNNYNTFQDNTIRDGATTPANLIYSAGSASAMNTGNSILNNNLFNFFSPKFSSAAVSVAANNSAWTISNNKIYQEVPRTYTTANQHYGIRVVSSTGNNFTISNNIIGYSSATGTGTYTMGGTVSTRFSAIALTAGTTTASNIQGNMISNIAITSSYTTTTGEGIFAGVAVLAGSVNIGSTSPNIIGSTTTNNVINITSTSSLGAIVGIYSTSSGVVNISNNKIGGFYTSGAATMGNTLRGINSAGSGSYTITGNEIGSASLADNFIAGIAGTTTANTDVTGIDNSASGTHTISGNTITNLSSYGAGTAGQIRGIASSSGVATITNNTISYLTSSSAATGTTTTASAIGISKTGTTADQTVSGNTIQNLSNTAATANTSVIGIYYTGSTTGTNLITKNTIRNLSVATTGLGVINGIYVGGGASTFSNNMISIGLDATGSSLTSGALTFSGIRLATTAANNFYFNSVHVTGTNVTTGTASTQAFMRSSTGIHEIKNNIFSNTRSNSTGTGKHYAINLNLTTTVTAGNNDYYFPNGLMGVVGTTDYVALGNWKISTGLDQSSITVDPMFLSSTDLHINNSTPSSLESGGVLIASVSTDFDNEARPGPAGSLNGGGTNPDIGADEFDGIPIALDMGATVLVSPISTGCYTANETVKIRIKNYAGSAMDFSSNPITVNVEVTGANPVVFTPVDIYSGTLAAGATLDTTINTTYNMTAAGQYIFKAATVLAGDANTGNDSIAIVTRTVSGGNVIASAGSICGGSSSTLISSGFTTGGTIQWQNSQDALSWSNISGETTNTYTYTAPSTFADTVYFRVVSCGLHNSGFDTVISEYVTPPTTTSGTRCGPGTVALSAAGTGTLNWYSASTGGSVLGTGTTFTTPSISTTTTYYVEAGSSVGGSAYVGKASTTGADSYNTGGYLKFDAVSAFNLNSVVIYPYGTGAGTVTIALQNSAGVTLQQYTTNATGTTSAFQPLTVPVNFSVLPGTNYRLTFLAHTGGVTGLIRDYSAGSGIAFPYTLPGVVSITDGSLAGYYYFFYNWQLATGCNSARTSVTATVTTPPAMTISSASSTICYGDSTTLSVSSANPYSYVWSPAGSLNSTTAASVIATPTATTKYFVNASDLSGCTNIDSVTINVNQLPIILPVTASATTICAGGSSQLLITPIVPQSYCTPRMSTIQASGDYLKNFTFGNISNLNSGDTPTDYTYYNSLTANIVAGTANTLTLEAGGTTTTYAMQFRIWIDYNQNGIFESTESVYNTTTSTYSPTVVTGSATVPVSAYNGITRMRVMARYSSTPLVTESCNGASTYGEYEDYNVNISGATINPSSNNLYSWSPSGSLSNSTINNPVASPADSTTYTVTVTNATTGCFIKDTIRILVNQNPIVNVGADTTICSNNNLTLNAGVHTSYVWSTTETTQNINVNLAGTYSVTVTDANGCSGTDAINVAVNTAPIVSLGADVAFCQNDSILLDAGTGFTSYNWSNGNSTQTTTALTAGTYSVTVTDINGCSNVDTVLVTVNPLPVVNLGTDISFCQNDSAMLDAGTGFITYSWSNSTSVQATTVSTTGTYSVTVTDNNGCVNSDAILVTVNSLPTVDLGPDASFCANSSTILDAGNGFSAYDWSDNSTTQTLTVNTAGTYYVTVTDNNACANSDTIIVSEKALPIVDLGADQIICIYDATTLDAGTGFSGYVWNDNSTAQTLYVDGSLLAAGTYPYSVMVTGANGCTATDVVNVTVDLCTGITEVNGSADFIIYPNPSQGQFTIETPSLTKDVAFEMTDIQGRVVYKEKISDFTSKTITLNDPAPGLYFLKIMVEGNITIKKININ